MTLNNNVAFLCHPYHRGGVTQWMLDAVRESVIQKKNVWFITIDPIGFIGEGERQTMKSYLFDSRLKENINIAAPKKGTLFQLGTLNYRAAVYAKELNNIVPSGTPVILSDDRSVWEVTKLLKGKFRFFGVLHSDDNVYFELLKEYSEYLTYGVAVSSRIHDKASRILPNKDIKTIPCGIVLPTIRKDKQDAILTLIWIGRIEERQKRVYDIPLIAQELRRKGLSFKWNIVGDGADCELLRRSIEELKLETVFEFTGWIGRNELYDMLDQSDILVITSNFEGMPIAVMEAFSKGLGVVSTYVSGVEDLENDILAKNVLRLYPVGETNKAVVAITELMGIDSQLIMTEARKLAEKYYSIEMCMQQYFDIMDNNHAIKINKTANLYPKLIYVISMFLSYIISSLRLIKYNLEIGFKFKD